MFRIEQHSGYLHLQLMVVFLSASSVFIIYEMSETCEKRRSQFIQCPGDIFKFVFFSNQQTKTPQCTVYYHIRQKKQEIIKV